MSITDEELYPVLKYIDGLDKLPYRYNLSNIGRYDRTQVASMGASCRIIYKDPVDSLLHHKYVDGICHGGLNSSDVNSIRRSALVVQTKIKGVEPCAGFEFDEEFVLKYYHWMLNESPFKHAFLTKDPVKGIEHGVLVDCDTDSGSFLGALICSRALTELHSRPVAPTVFKAAIAAGISYPLAMMMAYSSFTQTDGPVIALNLKAGQTGHSHSPFYAGVTDVDGFKQLMSGKPDGRKVGRSYKHPSQPWGGVHQLFSGKGTLPIFTLFEGQYNKMYQPVAPVEAWSRPKLSKDSPQVEQALAIYIAIAKDWETEVLGGTSSDND